MCVLHVQKKGCVEEDQADQRKEEEEQQLIELVSHPISNTWGKARILHTSYTGDTWCCSLTFQSYSPSSVFLIGRRYILENILIFIQCHM